ncbi:hypothetical protein DDB_G0275279 [Dictyostelium discoideum AX4]|uniref:Uncharacterized protein n=1 Tax=Dictyostelium discoideum TaxID=44689 RepID=Q86I36_DICDI|nr:hypothetical protein DDB_G0275279 [Dictyostelium discoideum AX4]EAL69920.1 hypothetical protein DDB_G0275279 [Dictyostelium discoideum AX4]|eukprot:XP_643805.1 hypothetical protein DDB_G0275279 [Dictyostelium discoideum AX4]
MVTSFENFNKLSDKEISEIVIEKLSGNNTIVYAFDGSTFKLNSNNENDMENIDQCSTAMAPNVSINKLLYDLVMMCQHGIKTICVPMWCDKIEDKSSDYLSYFIQYLQGLSELLENEQLVKMYKETNIRVIFYGDFKLLLKHCNALELLNKFELIMEQTKNNTNHTILLGTNIEEPSETIINNIISFYNLNGNVKPTSIDLIKQYYGVMVDQVSLYLGSHKFTTQGRPILICDKGNEDLYYSIGSHEYLSKNGFRKVLFDKLFCRKVANAKEYQLKIHDIKMMKQFYLNNCENVMGVGNVNPNGNYWYPDPQVILPSVDGAN